MKTPKPLRRKAKSTTTHMCCWCKKKRGGCVIEPNPPIIPHGKPAWICFHCKIERDEQMTELQNKQENKSAFTGTIVRECDYCGRLAKNHVTLDGKIICENCEKTNQNAMNKIKQLEEV